jgi:hypothetical protein
VDLERRVVRRVEAFRAGAVFRLRVAAAFRPAATRFGLFLDEVRFRVLAAFRAVGLRAAVLRVRVLAAFRAAVFRLRVAAAFRPAAARFGDFRAVDFRAVVRLRPAVDFLAGDFRAVDFLAVDLRAVDFLAVVLFLEAAFRAGAVLRFRVAAAFRPAAARFGDFRAVDFRAVVRLRPVEVARFAVLLAAVFFRVVAFLVAFRTAFRAVRDLVAATLSPSSDIPGAGVGIAVRSGAIMPPCSGALGRSTVSRSQPGLGGRYGSGIASSCSDVPISRPDVVSPSSSSFHGQVRSDIGMQPPPLCGSRVPYPADAEKMRGNDA